MIIFETTPSEYQDIEPTTKEGWFRFAVAEAGFYCYGTIETRLKKNAFNSQDTIEVFKPLGGVLVLFDSVEYTLEEVEKRVAERVENLRKVSLMPSLPKTEETVSSVECWNHLRMIGSSLYYKRFYPKYYWEHWGQFLSTK
jgi:hypothetical protein